jgi:hypothetical protein
LTSMTRTAPSSGGGRAQADALSVATVERLAPSGT